MKIVVLTILSLLAVATAQDKPRCLTGTRVQVENITAFDNVFASWCAEGQNFCNVFRYEQSIVNDGVGYNLTGEYGECAYAPADDCSTVLPFLTTTGVVKSCNSASCNATSEPCLNIAFPKAETDCSIPDDDVRLFPGCGMKSMIKDAFDCAAPFLYKFPHTDPDSCDDQLSTMLQCLGAIATICVDSNCRSMLDELPDFRSRFSEVSFWAASINSSHQLVEVVKYYTGGAVDLQFIVDEHMCRVNRTAVEATISQLEDAEVDIDELVKALFPTFNCPFAFSQIQSFGFQFLRDFYNSDNEDDTYRVFTDSVGRMMGVLDGCNVEIFQERLPEILGYLNVTVDADKVKTAFAIAMEFADYLPATVAPPQPAGCPVEAEGYEYGLVQLDCERFQNETSRCGRRKAWTCHFSEWRLNFLRTWLNEFYKRHGDEAISTPECANDNDIVKCKDSDKCCYKGPRGCNLCYCSGHDYDHSHSEILGAWRHSYNQWNKFFQSWQSLNRDDRCF